MNDDKENIEQNTNNDEIDLIEVALKIWAERKMIFKITAAFFILGLIVAFGSKKVYKSDCSFLWEDQNSGNKVGGLLAQFGGLAGINLGGNEINGSINPLVYQQIIESTPFMLNLLESNIRIEKIDSLATVFEYLDELDSPSFLEYVKKYTIGLPREIISLFQSDKDLYVKSSKFHNQNDFIKLSRIQDELIKELKKRISINIDEDKGLISLSVTMSDALASAEINNLIFKKLTKYIINYKIEKATFDYNFIKDRFYEAQKKYEMTQHGLAHFRDQNKNVSSAFFKTEEERLQNEFQIAFNVYNALAQQLEQAKISIQQSTPVFTVVNDIKIPYKKFKPQKGKILLLFTFFGLLAGLGLFFLNPFLKDIKIRTYSTK